MSNPLKLVPTDPTYLMIGAGARAVLAAWEKNKNLNSLDTVKIAYAAMLDAAPAIDTAGKKPDEREQFQAWLDKQWENNDSITAYDAWMARAALASPAIDAANMAGWETTSIANELWQIADACGYEQFRDAVTASLRKAYSDGWDDRKNGVSSVTYGDQK